VKSDFQSEIAKLYEEATRINEGREAALLLSRKLIQVSSKAIRNIHRGDSIAVKKLLSEAEQINQNLVKSIEDYPELFYAGYLHDSQKELVEAKVFLSLADRTLIPTKHELNVRVMTYLHGLAEAASEARRFILDRAREGNLIVAESILDQCEEIYDELIGFDFPDGMTGGLRRAVDSLRAVLERTRSDLSTTASQMTLIKSLESTRTSLDEINRKADSQAE